MRVSGAGAGLTGLGVAAALGVGLLQGGLHCSAMCGPFVLAYGLSARGAQDERGRWVQRQLAHNAGRVGTFALLGLLFGAAGGFVDAAVALAGVQAVAGLVGGAAMLLWAVEEARTGHAGAALERWSLLQWAPLRRRFGRVLSRRDPAGALAAGALLGLHPCGLLYAMLLSAAATGAAWRGALVMAAFGLGTVPALLGVAAAGAWGGARARGRAFRYLAAAFIGLSGVLFALRGLAVNGWIPEVNPWLF